MNKLFYIIILLLFFSCEKEENTVSNAPTLKFISVDLSIEPDMLGNDLLIAKLFLKYTDANANLGALTTPPAYQENCKVMLFTEGAVENPLVSSLVFPEIKIGETVAISPITIKSYNYFSGELKLKLAYPRGVLNLSDGGTLKFTVQVMDRDSLKSNIVEQETVFPSL